MRRPATALWLGGWLLLGGCGSSTADGSGAPDAVALDAADVAATPVVDVLGPDDVVPVADLEVASCAPVCPVSACAQDDGCGQACPPCPSDETCASCALRVFVLTRSGPIVTLAVDYAPPEGGALPSVADLRFRLTGDGAWLDAEVGAPILDAGKDAATDPETGKAWQLLEEGAVLRVVVLSPRANNTIAGGRWLQLRLRAGPAFGAQREPVVVRLDREEPTFAPPPADLPLVDAAVQGAIALWPPS